MREAFSFLFTALFDCLNFSIFSLAETGSITSSPVSITRVTYELSPVAVLAYFLPIYTGTDRVGVPYRSSIPPLRPLACVSGGCTCRRRGGSAAQTSRVLSAKS